MSKYIAALMVLPLLLFFCVQYGVQLKNQYIMTEVENTVYAAKEAAKQEGYFTAEIVSDMKQEIAVQAGVEETQIIVNVTTTPKYRENSFDKRDLIAYSVGVPIKSIIAAHKMWGIGDADNQMIYTVHGVVGSERLRE
ncbi:MAG: hypothetical protein PHC40_04935 [Eubacteriales bacterium]|nr:hypothetical protein [Eubacteriales bacterium]